MKNSFILITILIEHLDEIDPPIPLPVSRIIASKTAKLSNADKLLSRKLDEVTSKGFLTHNIAKANHMTETFKEIHVALASTPNLIRTVSYVNFIVKFWNNSFRFSTQLIYQLIH